MHATIVLTATFIANTKEEPIVPLYLQHRLWQESSYGVSTVMLVKEAYTTALERKNRNKDSAAKSGDDAAMSNVD